MKEGKNMKLRDLLVTIKPGTLVCICDEFGAHNDTCPIEKLAAISVIYILDREVEDIYLDQSDMSLTIDLVDYTREELEELK